MKFFITNVIVLFVMAISLAFNAEAARKVRNSSSGPAPTISGSSGNDNLVGTDSADVIAGLTGDDWLDGRANNDILTGGWGADTFVLRRGGGHDIVTDFVMTDSLATTDQVLLDFGTYSDIIRLGNLYDGLTFNNFNNTATFSVRAADVNNDGVTDTVIQADSDSITILSVAPEQIRGYHIYGG